MRERATRACRENNHPWVVYNPQRGDRWCPTCGASEAGKKAAKAPSTTPQQDPASSSSSAADLFQAREAGGDTSDRDINQFLADLTHADATP